MPAHRLGLTTRIAALVALVVLPIGVVTFAVRERREPASAAERSALASESESVRAGVAAKPREGRGPHPRSDFARVAWRRSTALGTHNAGSLVGGVRLPSEGRTFVTWDPVRRTTPNPSSRRNGTARLLRVLLSVARDDARANPDGPRLVVGDLSRPRGGDFGLRYGDLGDGKSHVSHQNGLDVDIYYPRSDGREAGWKEGVPETKVRFDRRRAQKLVDRFVEAGAQKVFVGTGTGLTGPPGVVFAEPRHNDHMHVRLPLRG